MSMELSDWSGVTIEIAPVISWDHGRYADSRPHYSVLYKRDGVVVGGSECYPLGYINSFRDGINATRAIKELWKDGYAVPENTPVKFVPSKEGKWSPLPEHYFVTEVKERKARGEDVSRIDLSYFVDLVKPVWHRWQLIVAGNDARLP